MKRNSNTARIVILFIFSFVISVILQILMCETDYNLLQEEKVSVTASFSEIDGYVMDGASFTTTTADPKIYLDATSNYIDQIEITFSEEPPLELDIQLFYTEDSMVFSQEASVFKTTTENCKVYILTIPRNTYESIRVDLGMEEGITFELESIQLLSYNVSAVALLAARISLIPTVLIFSLIFALLYLALYHREVYLYKNSFFVKVIIFVIFLIVSILMMVNQNKLSSPAPDENMRYQLVEYLYQYGVLPHGGDPQLQTAWGFSYAFLPYLSAIISAVFMKIASFFTQEADLLLLAARSVSVLCGCVTVIYIFKIADKLFHTAFKWVFVCTIVFLPQFVYISAYLNNDIAAFMSISMIVYYWIVGSEKNWNKQAVIGLSIGLSICILSYYNDYGFVLMSIVFYFVDQIKKKTPKLKMFQIAGCISFLCFCMAGWFFIYNAYLYDGDFLGLATLMEYKETYAIPWVLEQVTIQESGQSLFYMLVNKRWIFITVRSFIAVFGSMDIVVSNVVYLYYGLLFFIGTMLYVFSFIQNCRKQKKKSYLFEISILMGGFIAIVLSIYNSYTNDFQAQGRYIIAFLLPLSFFIAKGVESIRVLEHPKKSCYVALGLGSMNAIILIYCCVKVFI